jgi:hypothetical protein
MKFGRYIAAGAVLAALAVPAGAQSRSGAISNSVRLLGVPEVRKELKLTPAQTEQLTKLNAGMKTQLIDTLRTLKGLPATERTQKFASFRDGLDRKVVEMLDPAQRKRLRELELQQEGVRALTNPSFGAELRITPAQTTKIHQATQSESHTLRDLYLAASKKEPLSTADRAKLETQIATTRKRTETDLLAILTTEQRTRLKVMQGAPFTFPAPRVAVAPTAGVAAKPAAPKK